MTLSGASGRSWEAVFVRRHGAAVQVAGAAVALAAVLRADPDSVVWTTLLAGVVAVALLRRWAVPLSKFSYLTVVVVPLGALLLLGRVTEAVVAAWLGTLLADLLLLGRGRVPALVNSGREALSVAASAGVFSAVLEWTGGPDDAFSDGGPPAILFLVLAYFVFNRGLFYFSLAYRGKLGDDEWETLLRYEMATAALGTLGALATGATFRLYDEPAVWVYVLVFIAATGLLARELIVRAIASEELRKVGAMENVIAAGMPLSQALPQVEILARRLLDWDTLSIFSLQNGDLVRLHPVAPPRIAPPEQWEAVRREVAQGGEGATVVDARADPRVRAPGSPLRSLVALPLTYGQTVLGVLELGHARRAHYGPGELRLIERFGQQVAIAIQVDSLVNPMLQAASELRTELAALSSTTGEIRRGGEAIAAHTGVIRLATLEQGDATDRGVRETDAMASVAARMARDAAVSAERSRDAGRLAAENRTVIAQALERIVELRDFVQQQTDEVTTLAGSAASISGFVSTIREIADQTNLLALNAAIEAARAGDEGRGFAVVADEVRKLASSAGNASDEVVRLIEQIQAQADRTRSRIAQGSEAVAGVSELSQNALAALQHVVDATAGAGALAQGVAEQAADQERGARSVRDQIAHVAQVARSSAEGANEVAEATGDQAQSLGQVARSTEALQQVAERLNLYLARFLNRH